MGPDDLGLREQEKAGLCAACRHLQRNRNDRGSVFYYCRRSEADPRYPKYPALPVMNCPGFEADGDPK